MSAFTTLHLTRAKALQLVFKQMPDDILEDLANKILQDRLYDVVIVKPDGIFPVVIDDNVLDQLSLV